MADDKRGSRHTKQAFRGIWGHKPEKQGVKIEKGEDQWKEVKGTMYVHKGGYDGCPLSTC